MSKSMNLSQGEVNSPLWQKLMGHYRAELAEYRRRIEDPNMDERVRVSLCWKIRMIKELIAHGEPDEKNVTGAGR